MEEEIKIKPDDKTIKTWKHHLQDEVDASFLYSEFADLEPDLIGKIYYLNLLKLKTGMLPVGKRCYQLMK